MSPLEFYSTRKRVVTPSGTISYTERGAGPVALFLHGFPLNGFQWRHQIEALSDLRRCVAPDLMGLGHTDVVSDQLLHFDAQVRMLTEFLDALRVEQIDLVGNDSGGAIAQLLATSTPQRIRSLTLTNCDTVGNWPPPAFAPLQELAKAGQLGRTFAAFVADLALARSAHGLASAFEFPERLTSELTAIYLGPVTATAERQSQIDRYAAAIDGQSQEKLANDLKSFEMPTLIVWGNADPFFDAEGDSRWAHWLRDTIPGTRRLTVLDGAKLFFPEERPEELNALLHTFWTEGNDTSQSRPD